MKDISKYPKLLRAIIKHSKDLSNSVLIIDAEDPDLPIIDASDDFLELTGYTLNEITGKSFDFLCGPDTDQNTLNKFRAAFNKTVITTTDMINYKKDGSTFWNRVTIYPIKKKDDTIIYWVCIIRDITSLIKYLNKKTELNVMVTMIHTFSDIAFNYLNYLQLFRTKLDDDYDIDQELLKEFDMSYFDFLDEIRRLSDVEDFKEILLKKGIHILDTK